MTHLAFLGVGVSGFTCHQGVGSVTEVGKEFRGLKTDPQHSNLSKATQALISRISPVEGSV